MFVVENSPENELNKSFFIITMCLLEGQSIVDIYISGAIYVLWLILIEHNNLLKSEYAEEIYI